MVSILVQDRILGAAMGAAFGTGVVLYQQALIYRSTAQAIEFISGKPPVVPPSKVPEPLFNKRTRAELGHAWNVGVDKSLGALIASLSSRGW